jgi:hypothetical protein
VIDSWFPNFYDTTGKRFSEFGLGVVPIIKCDVYISSVDEFITFFNDNSVRYKLQKLVVPTYQKIMKFRVQDSQNGNALVTTNLVGDGWEKLGFTSYAASQTHTGTRITDFSMTPSIIVRILNGNLKNQVMSVIGSGHF